MQHALCLTPFMMYLILIFRSAAATVVLNTTCHHQGTGTMPCGTVMRCTNLEQRQLLPFLFLMLLKTSWSVQPHRTSELA